MARGRNTYPRRPPPATKKSVPKRGGEHAGCSRAREGVAVRSGGHGLTPAATLRSVAASPPSTPPIEDGATNRNRAITRPARPRALPQHGSPRPGEVTPAPPFRVRDGTGRTATRLGLHRVCEVPEHGRVSLARMQGAAGGAVLRYAPPAATQQAVQDHAPMFGPSRVASSTPAARPIGTGRRTGIAPSRGPRGRGPSRDTAHHDRGKSPLPHRSESATERGEPRRGLGCTESARCPNMGASAWPGCKAPQVALYSGTRRPRQRSRRSKITRPCSAQAVSLLQRRPHDGATRRTPRRGVSTGPQAYLAPGRA